MLAWAIIYCDNWQSADDEPPKSYFSGADAAVPVAMFRSDWSDQAAYLGVKAGSPSWAHGHMDAGSFVTKSMACAGPSIWAGTLREV